jgi:hypothetical protein
MDIKHQISWRFRELKRSIQNVVYYLPIIWKDRDWDHGYMETIMLAKLKKWYKRYSNIDGLPLPYEGIEKDLQAMRICINILQRRKDSWYDEVCHSRYGYKIEMKFVKIPNTDLSEIVFEGLSKEEDIAHIELRNKCNQVYKRDWKLYCTIFEKYFEKWWD